MSSDLRTHARLLDIPAPGSPPRTRVPVPERWTLANGLRVVVVPRRNLPQVAMRLVLPAGSAADPADLAGTASLVGSLLSEGTELRSADDLNLWIDSLGASFSAQVGHDFAELDLFLLGETLGEGIELLAEMVTRPGFPQPELERVRAETLDALEARGDEPANVADDRLAEELFGPGHPYGRLSGGTPEGVSAVDREELRRFHAERYVPEGAVLAVAGDFDLEELAARLERAFAGWTGRLPPDPAVPEAVGPSGRRRVWLEWPDAAQGEIRFGGIGLHRAHPDWVPAAVANYLLGGSTITGRLGANLREDKGWTYGIRSGFAAALRPGGWVVETAVDAGVIDDAVGEIVRELERFVSEPVSDEELGRAKDALVLSLPRAFETPGRIISRFATVEAFGLPADYWERFPDAVAAVDRADVLRIARAHFAPERLLPVVVGPPLG